MPTDFFIAARHSVISVLILLLAACTSTAPGPSETDPDTGPADAATYLEQAARDSEDGSRQELLLSAGESALEDGNLETAAELQELLREEAGDPAPGDDSPLRLRRLLLEASLQQADNEPADALRTLNSLPAPRWQATSTELYRQWLQQRISTLLDTGQRLAAIRDLLALHEVLPEEQQQANRNRIWGILTATPDAQLGDNGSQTSSYELRGWLELLGMMRSSPENIEDRITAIRQWRNRWNRHPAADTLPDALAYLIELWENRPSRLALLLPLQQAAGNAVAEGFMGAYYQALEQNQDVPVIRVYDTSNARRIPAIYRQAVEDGAELIIGPLDKEAVRNMQNRRSMPVSTLALNYTDSDFINPEGLYQFGLAPEDDIRQLTRTARRNGHRHAAVLTPEGEEYQRIRQFFERQWQSLDGEVIDTSSFTGSDSYSEVLRQLLAIDESESRFEQLATILPRQEIAFIPRRRQDIDFLFLLATPEQGRQIAPTLDFFYAGDVPIYAMPSIHDGGSEPGRNRDLNGILFTELPWLLQDQDSELKQRVDAAWSSASAPAQRLRALGIDSYRLYTRLGQLISYPDTRMQGVTGTLALRDDGTIQRILPVARFSSGIAERLSPVVDHPLAASSSDITP